MQFWQPQDWAAWENQPLKIAVCPAAFCIVWGSAGSNFVEGYACWRQHSIDPDKLDQAFD